MSSKSVEHSHPRETSGRRERRPTDKIIQKNAEEAANAERLRIEKERKAQRARVRAHQCIDNDQESDEDEHEYENTFANNTFITRTVASKPQALKEMALVSRTNRVPLSETVNDSRHHSNQGEIVRRGRTAERSTQHYTRDMSNSSNHSQDALHKTTYPSHVDLNNRSGSHSPIESFGQKRRASSSDSLHDTQTTRFSKGSRPKASDFDDIIQAILSSANKEYRCKISTIYAYPSTSQVITFSTESWNAACERLGVEVPLTPRITRVIIKGNSQLRGELKTKAQPLVETYYGFDLANNPKAIKKNRHMAELLKEKHNFTYKDMDITSDPPIKQGLYQSKLIQKIVNRVWFVNPRDEGIIFEEYFNPITKECLALVLTAIEACLDEWITGVRIPQNFKGSDYEDIYKAHINELTCFEKHTIKYELLDRILIRLYNRGRFHAGAQPLSTIGFPIIPDSAFDNAIQEYEEGSGTDTDGESGDRD